MASAIMPWLLSGGTLTLHQPFDPPIFEKQTQDDGCDVLVAPAPLILQDAFLDGPTSLRHLIGVWRTPELAARSILWTRGDIAMTDVLLFGEIGLLAARRLADGAPAPLPSTTCDARRSRGTASEIALTPHDTLGLRGAMVPHAAYYVNQSGDPLACDHVDTGYGVQRNTVTGTVEIVSAPSGLVNVGGYRFRASDLDEWAQRLAPDVTLGFVPDPLNGSRLVGRAHNNTRAAAALSELGLNPLMVAAFRDRNSTL